MGNLKLFLIPFFLLVVGCAKNQAQILNPGQLLGNVTPPPVDEKPTFLQGEFQTTEQELVSIDAKLTKPMVLIFSQDTCLVCRAEAKMLVEKFSAEGKIPTNIDLYTLLVSTVLEDAEAFKEDLGIVWKVGFQAGDSLFRKVCPGLKVPCVVVQVPEKGFVFKKSGPFEVEEIEKFTGKWE